MSNDSQFLKYKNLLKDLPPIRDEQNLPFDAWERYCYLYNFANQLNYFLYYSCWPKYQIKNGSEELTIIYNKIIELMACALPKKMVEEIKDKILASMSIYGQPKNPENNFNRYYCQYCGEVSPNPLSRNCHPKICFGASILEVHLL